MKYKRKRTRRCARGLVVLAAVLAAAALVIVGLTLLPGLFEQVPPVSQPDSSVPEAVITTTTATTATTTTTTTTTTTAKSTTTTKAKPTTTRSPELDANGLLMFDTEGRYVQAKDGTYAGDWKLLLVNDWNPITSDYEKSVSFTAVGNNQRVDSRMVADLKAMLEAGKAHGIGVQSGYRSAEHQGTLYWRQVQYKRNAGLGEVAAQKAAGQIVKRPGYSEHNSGLAVDLGGSGNFRLEQDFEYTAAFEWLIKNCADYGFILRFPKGKENVTGVIYEPWHYRYVGKEAAKVIMESNLCLEEYLERTGQ